VRSRDAAFYDDCELTTRADGTKVAPSGAPVGWAREPSDFFDLSKWQDKLLDPYETPADFIARWPVCAHLRLKLFLLACLGPAFRIRYRRVSTGEASMRASQGECAPGAVMT
jgi:hypothetical protein